MIRYEAGPSNNRGFAVRGIALPLNCLSGGRECSERELLNVIAELKLDGTE